MTVYSLALVTTEIPQKIYQIEHPVKMTVLYPVATIQLFLHKRKYKIVSNYAFTGATGISELKRQCFYALHSPF